MLRSMPWHWSAAEQNVTIFSLLASLPPRSVTLRCSNETVSRVTFECDSAVSIIRESDQLKYPRYTVLEVACGKESVIARSCREVDYVRYIGIHANLQEIGARNKVLTLLRDGFSRCPHGSQVACLVHISLPCKGGSPLLNFWGRNEKHEKEFFYLLKSSGKYLDEIKSYLKECLSLFRSNCRKAISTGRVEILRTSSKSTEWHIRVNVMPVQWIGNPEWISNWQNFQDSEFQRVFESAVELSLSMSLS